jgi:hypothetical protein
VTTIAITMAALAVCALLVWGWLVLRSRHRAELDRVRAAGAEELLEHRRAVCAFLAAYSEAKHADGDKLTASALFAAGKYIHNGMTFEEPAAMQSESRRIERGQGNGFANGH